MKEWCLLFATHEAVFPVEKTPPLLCLSIYHVKSCRLQIIVVEANIILEAKHHWKPRKLQIIVVDIDNTYLYLRMELNMQNPIYDHAKITA